MRRAHCIALRVVLAKRTDGPIVSDPDDLMALHALAIHAAKPGTARTRLDGCHGRIYISPNIYHACQYVFIYFSIKIGMYLCHVASPMIRRLILHMRCPDNLSFWLGCLLPRFLSPVDGCALFSLERGRKRSRRAGHFFHNFMPLVGR